MNYLELLKCWLLIQKIQIRKSILRVQPILNISRIDLNKFVPRSKHEFQVYAELLAKKFEKLNESPFYTDFACDATRSLIKGLNLEKTRKVEQVLSVQINELVKATKGKKKATKKKPVLGGMEKGGKIPNPTHAQWSHIEIQAVAQGDVLQWTTLTISMIWVIFEYSRINSTLG